MNHSDTATIIAQTKKWITDVVVGCNFCPFASREMKRGSIHYEVMHAADQSSALEKLLLQLQQLDEDKTIETSLLIFPGSFLLFDEYLDLVELAEELLATEEYEGVYQVASFHPDYLFAGSTTDDPSNFTNRSPYPMLHLLREESVSRAVDSHPDIDAVPEQNIAFAREKGLKYMQQLFAQSLMIP